MDDALIALTGKGVFVANASSLLKRNFYCIFVNVQFFSLLGALDFLASSILFLQKILTDASSQLPNKAPVLNNWLMSDSAGCDRDYGAAALTQRVL